MTYKGRKFFEHSIRPIGLTITKKMILIIFIYLYCPFRLKSIANNTQISNQCHSIDRSSVVPSFNSTIIDHRSVSVVRTGRSTWTRLIQPSIVWYGSTLEGTLKVKKLKISVRVVVGS